jgi:hypothetical protein
MKIIVPNHNPVENGLAARKNQRFDSLSTRRIR